jgi:hypothetical protein
MPIKINIENLEQNTEIHITIHAKDLISIFGFKKSVMNTGIQLYNIL